MHQIVWQKKFHWETFHIFSNRRGCIGNICTARPLVETPL